MMLYNQNWRTIPLISGSKQSDIFGGKLQVDIKLQIFRLLQNRNLLFAHTPQVTLFRSEVSLETDLIYSVHT